VAQKRRAGRSRSLRSRLLDAVGIYGVGKTKGKGDEYQKGERKLKKIAC
jgi:hypothetical protein